MIKNIKLLGVGLVLVLTTGVAVAKSDYPKTFSGDQLKSSKMLYTLPVRAGHNKFEYIDTTAANIIGEKQYEGRAGEVPSYWVKNSHHGFVRGQAVLVPVFQHHRQHYVEYVYGIVLGKAGDVYVVQISKHSHKHMPNHVATVEVVPSRIYKFDAQRYKQVVQQAGKNMMQEKE